MQPYAPVADYCTHCGSALGIAETTAYPLPVPNSPRFSEHHDAGEPAPRPRWVRAVAVFWGVLFVVNIGFMVLAAVGVLVTGTDASAQLMMGTAVPVSLLSAIVAAVISYRRAGRA